MGEQRDGTDTTDRIEGPVPTRRWLRWGSVYVDIEPPYGANPWTAPTIPGVPDAPVPAPTPTPRSSRRPAVLFAFAAVVSALLGALLVVWLRRDERVEPPRVVPSTTAAARPSTTLTRPSTAPAPLPSQPGPSTTPTTAAGTAPSTTAIPPPIVTRPGGPITIPEGAVPSSAPSTAPAPAPAPTLPPTAVPVRPTTTTTGPRAFLGVTVDLSGDGPQVLDIFPGSGAEQAGLLPLDVITAVDGVAVVTTDELGAAILSHQPGDSITVTVLRNGATVTVRATLGSR